MSAQSGSQPGEGLRIAVFGAGAIGTVLGAYLSLAGLDVMLVSRNAQHIEALRGEGAAITGQASLNVPVRALLPQQMYGYYDVVFLLTKQQENEKTAAFLRPYLTPGDGMLCSLQNGIPELALQKEIAPRQLAGGAVAWGASMVAPGVCALTSDAGTQSFSLAGTPQAPLARLQAIGRILAAMGPVQWYERLVDLRWTKLLINASFSAVGTLIGGTFGDVLACPGALRLAHQTLKECLGAGHALGIRFGRIDDRFEAAAFDYDDCASRQQAQQNLCQAMQGRRDIIPSMLQDIRRGRATEIAAINGTVCAQGRQAGRPTPCNDALVRAIQAIERGEKRCGVENLALFDGV